MFCMVAAWRSTSHIFIGFVTMMKKQKVYWWKLGGSTPRFQSWGAAAPTAPPPGSCVLVHLIPIYFCRLDNVCDFNSVHKTIFCFRNIRCTSWKTTQIIKLVSIRKENCFRCNNNVSESYMSQRVFSRHVLRSTIEIDGRVRLLLILLAQLFSTAF